MFQKFILKQKSQKLEQMCKDDIINLISNNNFVYFYDITLILYMSELQLFGTIEILLYFLNNFSSR
jgi:hypothetical protein